jgi:hypothetical protein
MDDDYSFIGNNNYINNYHYIGNVKKQKYKDDNYIFNNNNLHEEFEEEDKNNISMLPEKLPLGVKQDQPYRKLNTPVLVNHKLISHMKNNPVPNIVVAEHSVINNRDQTMNKIEDLLNKYKIADKSFDRSISPINRSK